MKDSRIDAYVARSEDFAKPILKHLRELVHQTCPDIVETIKWGFPHFDNQGILCSMAAFKHHCSFGFWKATLMEDYAKHLHPMDATGMGHFGKLKTLNDLPSEKILVTYIKEAVRLNRDGVKLQRRPSQTAKIKLTVPPDFKKALVKNKKALMVFEEFNYSNKKDYLEWITEAKTETTRSKRLATTVEWLSEGKIRNWKYVRK